jgi:hypothetical protein
MDRRVLIMCDTRASGITADLNDSYFVRIERRPDGGTTVLWTDLPDQARVFEDAAAAEEFCREGPLEMFVVSFVPAPGRHAPAPALGPPPRPAESEADFLKRLSRIRAEAEAKHAKVSPDEADELRALGLM